MIVWAVSNPYHSMAIPWVVSMNIASEKSVFPNATKWEKVQSPFQCVFDCFSGECSYFLQDG